MIGKHLDKVEFNDLQGLVRDGVEESRRIEYKSELPSDADSDKQRFLAGVSALANSFGGDFVIGVSTTNGKPSELKGVEIRNPDAERIRLEQILQNGLEPRLQNVEIKIIEGDDSRGFVLIRVARSWIGPHRVKANSKFYSRSSAGKYPMDFYDLRSAFLANDTVTDKASSFRADRLNKIKGGGVLPGIKLQGGAKLVVHLLPLSAFSLHTAINLRERLSECQQIMPLNSGAATRTVNLEGILAYSRTPSGAVESYGQLFLSGCVELVHVLWRNKQLAITYYERRIVDEVGTNLKLLKKLDISPPILLSLSLLDAGGISAVMPESLWHVENVPLGHTHLILNEQFYFEYDQPIDKVMRPIFDSMWNAFGVACSPSFNDDGTLREQDV